jgi:D-sedoheptulose 7-phosphate isomerase
MMIAEQLSAYAEGLKKSLDSVPVDKFEELVQLMESSTQEGRQVFVMGNGGSGSTASHMVCDLNKGVSFGLEKRLRVICLNDNVATILAYANDVSYDEVFVEQLKNFVRPGDVVIGISGSGNSLNVLKAIRYANEAGAHTVGLTGFDGGKLAKEVKTSLWVNVHDMQKAEDVHLIIFHVLMQVLYERFHASAEPSRAARA